MALTKEQQAQLDELQAQRDAPPVRTTTGLAGILHHLIDVTSGRVAHVAPGVVDELHERVEDLAGDKPAGQPADDGQGDDETPAE